MAILYLVVQCIGACLGFFLLILLTPFEILDYYQNEGLCTTVPHESLTMSQVFLIEYCATSILILLCGAVWDPRNRHNSDSVPLKFAFAIAAIGFAAGKYTGGSMNPARSLAPAIWSGDFAFQWVKIYINSFILNFFIICFYMLCYTENQK